MYRFVWNFSLVDIRPLFLLLLLPKVPIVLTNALKQKLYKIKFPKKKSVGACLYLLQKWSQGTAKICQFWDRALEWGSMFTLGQNTANSTDYIKKCFNQKLSKIIFPTEISQSAYVYLP